MFKYVVLSVLEICLITGTVSQINVPRDEQLWPSKQVGVLPNGRVSFLLRSPSSLQNCIFTFPTGSTFDFSSGHNSTKIGPYQGYYGLGLYKGHCGCSFLVANASFEGVVTCKFRRVGSREWFYSASTLRITEAPNIPLPSFEIAPRFASLQTGETTNITCNAENRPLEVCRFILPDGTEVNFDRGSNSRLTDEYRYSGTGLANGKCGITIRGGAKYNGHILCKIGNGPLTSNGRWHMGVMEIETKDRAEFLRIRVNEPRRIIRARPKTVTTRRPAAAMPGTDCGRNHLDPVSSLISGGTDAVVGEFPWHAGIYKFSGTTYVQQCGGTLITVNIVLTAAHCFVSEVTGEVGNSTLYRVGLGKHYRDWAEEDRRVQRFRVKKIIVEPRYRGRLEKFQFDIAVVVLNRKARITDFVDVICIDWDSSSKNLQLADGSVGVAIGWGATENDTASTELQTVKLPFVPDSACKTAITEDAAVVNYYTADKFCAGYRNKNTSVCKGDSGGGIFFMNSTTQSYFLRGVTSVSFEISKVRGQCANQFFTGFTDVAKYIKDLIQPALFN